MDRARIRRMGFGDVLGRGAVGVEPDGSGRLAWDHRTDVPPLARSGIGSLVWRDWTIVGWRRRCGVRRCCGPRRAWPIARSGRAGRWCGDAASGHLDARLAAWGDARQYDLVVTMEGDASAHYSAFLVDQEGKASSFQGLREVMARHGLFCSLYTNRDSHYFVTPEAGGKVSARDRVHRWAERNVPPRRMTARTSSAINSG
jgi:hypothetical protein